MALFFVNYRRDDARWAAGRICDRLLSEFGRTQVFLDTITIDPGDDFVETIEEKIEASTAILVIIGKRWLEILNNKASIGQSIDFVRIELEVALRHGIRIIPLTIDDVEMIQENSLPKELMPLARRNSIPLRSETFHLDIARLITFLTTLSNNDSRNIESDLRLQKLSKPTAQIPEISFLIKHETKFWKKRSDGRPLRKIVVWIEADDIVMNKIKKIVYQLDPTFKNPIREIFDRSTSFELRTNGWGAFDLRADIYLNDNEHVIQRKHFVSFD